MIAPSWNADRLARDRAIASAEVDSAAVGNGVCDLAAGAAWYCCCG
eukprot:CAMPEP_0181318476 /NCGR_PEP_ID=MMETSP1101-20121128/17023_1 /TAXON_ID=46948 /ORGANISM="Rhodomonas abbreviata, Strain Caron Lab Isolate" /LENGTH=45 /DNA_ID= /DNA_START= /DNA_END= /DNA_ORIENTATION=